MPRDRSSIANISDVIYLRLYIHFRDAFAIQAEIKNSFYSKEVFHQTKSWTATSKSARENDSSLMRMCILGAHGGVLESNGLRELMYEFWSR